MIRAAMDATILPPWSALRSRPGGGMDMLAAMVGKGRHSCGRCDRLLPDGLGGHGMLSRWAVETEMMR